MYQTALLGLRFVPSSGGSQERRSTSVSSRWCSVSHHRTLRSLSGLWEQPNSWAPPTTCTSQLCRRTVGPRPLRRALPPHQKPLTGFCRAALNDTLKNHLATVRGGGKLNGTVSGPALRPCEEPPLDDSSSVVAGSSADSDWITCRDKERKGKHLMYCVQQAGCPAISSMEP